MSVVAALIGFAALAFAYTTSTGRIGGLYAAVGASVLALVVLAFVTLREVRRLPRS